MQGYRWYNISLAGKCLVLFGAAVILILAATLYLPWQQMQSFADTADVRSGQVIAAAARGASNVDYQEWDAAAAQLLRDWPATSRSLMLVRKPPELISKDDLPELRRIAPRGFLVEAFREFQKDPNRLYVFKFQEHDDLRRLRLAMAVRTSETDPQPNQLRGILHVRMPVDVQNRQWSVIVLLLAGLSGCVLAVLVFYFVTQRLFLSPVRDLRELAEQVTEGDMNVRAEIATGDEFEDLGEAFNDMLTRIKESHDELRTINRSLDVKLGQLAEANVALFESNKLKTEFIANVSHELRTPMGLIINFAELLRDAIEDPPEDTTRLTRYANHILKAGRSLLEMINDLLDLAKIEAGKVELHVTEFSIEATCAALVDFVRPLADKKRIALEVSVEKAPANLHSDAGKVKQVLYNLLSNAIKFTPEGGTVEIAVNSAGSDYVTFDVRDTGPGIDPEMVEAIFEKFRQIDSSLTREHGGSGLGLAITKELVHLLGGTISVESTVGVGSTFTVRLPRTAPREPQRKLIPLTN
jgi:two-component system, NarL family, sensor histidine kinase BarA